jgi:hypothetical protein
MRTTFPRWILATGAGLVLALSGPGLAAADTEISESGLIGQHKLVDTATYPGADCSYEGNTLFEVSVRPPKMRARDRTAGLDEQLVGWRARLQKQTATGWATVQTSSVRKAMASDDHWAGFTQRAVFSVPPPFGKAVRVRVDMTWYAPTDPGTAQGHSTHEVDLYKTHGFGPTFNQHDECVFSAG